LEKKLFSFTKLKEKHKEQKSTFWIHSINNVYGL